MRTPRDGFNPNNRTLPNIRSSDSHIQRLEQIRAEVAEQILQRRLMQMIKTEHDLVRTQSQLKEVQTSLEKEYGLDTNLEPKKNDPIPAFPPVEDGVDFSWIYQPFPSVREQRADDDEERNLANEPGLLLIMTPILLEKQDEESSVVKQTVENPDQKTCNLITKNVTAKVSNFITERNKVILIPESNIDDSDSDDESFTLSVISDNSEYEFN